jgi:hypothetical protein
MTVSDLLDKCEGTIWHPDNVRSQRTIRSNVKILRGLIGDEAVEDMTFTRLEQLVQDMKARGYQPATVKRKLAMLARALKMATMWTDEKGQPLLRYKPPLPFIKVDNLKDRIITPVEEEACSPRSRSAGSSSRGASGSPSGCSSPSSSTPAAASARSSASAPSTSRPRSATGSATSPSRATAPRAASRGRCPWPAVRSTALGTLMDHLVARQGDRRVALLRLHHPDRGRHVPPDPRGRDAETGMDLDDVSIHTIRHTVLTRLAQGGMDLARSRMGSATPTPRSPRSVTST